MLNDVVEQSANAFNSRTTLYNIVLTTSTGYCSQRRFSIYLVKSIHERLFHPVTFPISSDVFLRSLSSRLQSGIQSNRRRVRSSSRHVTRYFRRRSRPRRVETRRAVSLKPCAVEPNAHGLSARVGETTQDGWTHLVGSSRIEHRENRKELCVRCLVEVNIGKRHQRERA